MEGFCRGCLIKYDEPTDLLQYTEKNRRLYVYSTGLQVKRNDALSFQLCKDCYLNMKLSCKFKKQCRASDKRFKQYLALKETGDANDFCTFLKNNDDTFTFRLPLLSGNSTPAYHKPRDDDNESTCTSIRNFMADFLRAEEIPDAEARIIREVIEEEADVLDESLDSHWLQDDASIDTNFRLDFSFSPFSTPRTTNNDRCLTPQKLKESTQSQEEINYFAKKILKECAHIEDHLSPLQADDLFDDENHISNKNDLAALETENADLEIKNHVYRLQNKKSYAPSIKKENCVSNIKTGNCLNLQDQDHLQSENHVEKNKIWNSERLQDKIDMPNLKSEKRATKFSNVSNSKLQFGDLPKLNTAKDMPDLDTPFDDVPTISKVKFYIENNHENSKSIEKVINKVNFYIDNDHDNCKTIEDVEVVINEEKCYIDNSTEINKAISIKGKTDVTECPIDTNLEEALKQGEDQFSLDRLLGTPRAPAASTPTIHNIIFGEKIDLVDELYVKPCVDAENEEIDIFKDFFYIDDDMKSDVKHVDIPKEAETESLDETDDIDPWSRYGLTERSCKHCDKTYKSDKHFKKHIKKCGKPTQETTKYIDPSSRYDLTDGTCKICDKKFKDAKALRIHFTKIHKESIVDLNKNKKKVRVQRICDYCGKGFYDYPNLIRHIRGHTKPQREYKCARCPLQCSTAARLRMHMVTHLGKAALQRADQENRKKYVCDTCGAVAHNASNHYTHVRRHTKSYRYHCAECGCGFYRNSDLTIHMRKHNGERPYACTYCPMRFPRRDALNAHEKRHTQERPFKCVHCETTFKTGYNLKMHENNQLCVKRRLNLEIKKLCPDESDENALRRMKRKLNKANRELAGNVKKNNQKDPPEATDIKNGSEPQIDTQNSNLPQIYTENSHLPQIDTQNSNEPQMDTQNSSVPQIDTQNSNVPQIDTQNSHLPQIDTQNSHLPQIDTQNSHLPQIDTQNSNVPQIDTQNINLPRIFTQNSNVPQIDTQNSNLPQIDIQNSNLPQIDTQNSNLPQIDTQNSHVPPIDTQNRNEPQIDAQNSIIDTQYSYSNGTKARIRVSKHWK